MKGRIIYSVLLSMVFNLCLAQDAQFSQFHSNALYLNPAFAGAFVNPVFTTSYRYQWPNLDGNFKTASVEYNQFISKLHGGIGGYILYDNAGGTIITEAAKFIYSYHLEIDNKVSVQPALGAGYTNKHLNMDNLTFGDPIDPRYGFIYSTPETKPNDNKGFFDCNAGVLIYSKYIYGGFAADHLTQPNDGFYSTKESSLPIKYTVHGGANIPMSDSAAGIYLSPSLIYTSQEDFSMWLAQITMKVKCLLAGIGYRENDAVIFNIGYQNNFIRIGYSYDKTTSKLADVTGGAHEIFLSYTLKSKKSSSAKMSLQSIAF